MNDRSTEPGTPNPLDYTALVAPKRRPHVLLTVLANGLRAAGALGLMLTLFSGLFFSNFSAELAIFSLAAIAGSLVIARRP